MILITLCCLLELVQVVSGQGETSREQINTADKKYDPRCGTPNGPCGPGYGWQFNWFPGPDTCPDPQPCPDGYFCLHDGFAEEGDNICLPQPKNCGNLLENCCVPHVCEGKGESGEPLACQAIGGPYFAPGGGLCMPNPKCGKLGQPCCQSWGHRDAWFGMEWHDGDKGNLCEGDLYCEFNNCRRETPISGTCVANADNCGTKVGAPCCITTGVSYVAYDDAVQKLDCDKGPNLTCDVRQDIPTCIHKAKETETNKKLQEMLQQCGQPGGSCLPAWNGTMFLSSEYFPQITCPPEQQECPPDYFCGFLSSWMYGIETELPMCLGPVDPECGKLGKPCCPWTIDSEKNKHVDGNLWCKRTDEDENPLQCIYKYDNKDSGYIADAIIYSRCVKNEPCGSLNQPCCRFRELYSNPPSVVSIRNKSLACGEGLFCNYTDTFFCPDFNAISMDNYHIRTEEGTCVANPVDCGSDIGKPCCVRSVQNVTDFARREEYYCDISKNLVCDPDAHRVRLGHGAGYHPTCVKETTETTNQP